MLAVFWARFLFCFYVGEGWSVQACILHACCLLGLGILFVICMCRILLYVGLLSSFQGQFTSTYFVPLLIFFYNNLIMCMFSVYMFQLRCLYYTITLLQWFNYGQCYPYEIKHVRSPYEVVLCIGGESLSAAACSRLPHKSPLPVSIGFILKIVQISIRIFMRFEKSYLDSSLLR